MFSLQLPTSFTFILFCSPTNERLRTNSRKDKTPGRNEMNVGVCGLITIPCRNASLLLCNMQRELGQWSNFVAFLRPSVHMLGRATTVVYWRTIRWPPRRCVYFLIDCDTTQRKFKNSVFTLKIHQKFSVHTTLERFENAAISGQFWFEFDENSVREITWLSWRHLFPKTLIRSRDAGIGVSGRLSCVCKFLRLSVDMAWIIGGKNVCT